MHDWQTKAREHLGMEIAAQSKIDRRGPLFLVPSQSGKGRYTVSLDPAEPFCSCPDFEEHQQCKHLFAAQYVHRRENADGSVSLTEAVIMSKTRKVPRPTYRQDWPNYNLAQTREKREFYELLFDLCQNHLPPVKRGRGRPALPPEDIMFSVVTKVYSTISTRRFMCDLDEAHEKGYLSRLPHYNSICKYLEDEALTPVLHDLIGVTARALASVEVDFAVDSTGFTCRSYTRWFDKKYRGKKEKSWVKLHAMAGVKTNVITAVLIKDRDAADSPQLPELLDLTARHFKVSEVSADKGYASVNNHEVVAAAGAQAYIKHKKNASERRGGIWAKSVHLFKYRHDEFKAHYHKRSNIETSFWMTKSKFGGYVRSKTPTAMVNESSARSCATIFAALFSLSMNSASRPNSLQKNSMTRSCGRI